MAEQPTGTVTMLFTDIEGSTRLLERIGPDQYGEALDLHRRLLRRAFEAHGGYEVDCEGDAFFVAFASAQEAVSAAAEAQQALAAASWPDEGAIRVRMGLHTGEPLPAPPKYVGLDVHKAARIMAAGHGGQVLLSQTTRAMVTEEFSVRELGEHRLKDLSAPQQLYQLGEGEFPSLKSLGTRTNLPVQPTALVGRRREVELVRDALIDGGRLLTITGPGGTGKTRLALQAVAELVDHFDGVFLVDLAPVTDPEFVLPTIAQTLGLRELEGQLIEDTLVEYLRPRSLLLLLDNFEQVLEGAPPVGALVSTAPMLSVLVTSRAPLRLAAEREYPLAPLAVPATSSEPLADMATVESVALFLERARAVQPAFVIDERNAPSVAEICARLDGLPLAIELAAARVRHLPPEALLARLGERLRFLTGGARDLPQRQRTLRDTIEWSYQLLDDDARLLFDRLAVFVGGRSLDAIESICVPDGEIDAIDALSTLVDNSLLRQEGGSEPRYVMLETIHEYARERLTARGEADALRLRHLAHFRALVKEAAPQLRRSSQADALELLEGEQGNIRAALTTALEKGDVESALTIANGCAYFWESKGRFFEAREWFARVLGKADDGSRQPLAELLFWAGRLAILQAEWRAALDRLDRSSALAREEDDKAVEALALGKAGWALVEIGQAEEGIDSVERAIELARECDDDWVLAEVLNDLVCSTFRADLERATEAAARSLQLRRTLGDEINVADSLNNLGYCLILAGDHESARPPLEESLDLARRLSDTRHVALAVGNLAIVSLFTGKIEQSRGQFTDFLRLSEGLGDTRGSLEALVGLAAIAAIDGQHQTAALLSGAVRALHAAAGGTPSPGELVMTEAWLEPARKAVGADAWEADSERGRALSLEQATALAVEAAHGRPLRE